MIQKLKSVVLSLLPIVAIVLLIHFTMYRFESATLFRFLIGLLFLIAGQVVFLTGIENSIVPMGEFVGNSMQDTKRFYVYIIFGFVFGVLSTIAEPDFQVLANKIIVAGIAIPKWTILIGVGVGVGIMLSLGLVRIMLGKSLNIILVILYLLIVVLGVFLSEELFAVSLDAGAGTVGVVASPFLLAFGVGVAKMVSNSRRNLNGEQNFGLISLTSAGSIIAMEIICLVSVGDAERYSVGTVGGSVWVSTLFDALFSILPLIVVFFIFEAIFIKISKQEKIKLSVGSLITFLGFYLFLIGIEIGFSEMGTVFGKALVEIDNLFVMLLLCSILGFFVVFCEPSIRVVANQIEEITNRNVKAKFIVGAIAVSIVFAIILNVFKIYFDFSIWWIFGFVFGLVFVLMPFTPKLFAAIAFDSGGVATGTITVAFIFPIMLALSENSDDGFGSIGVMVMTPVLVIEVIGLAFKLYMKSEVRKSQRALLRLSKTEDKYSNVEKLRVIHERDFDGRIL